MAGLCNKDQRFHWQSCFATRPGYRRSKGDFSPERRCCLMVVVVYLPSCGFGLLVLGMIMTDNATVITYLCKYVIIYAFRFITG